jgi:hypothetical protein
MATMETWEISNPGLQNLGMDVSHVLMGDMRRKDKFQVIIIDKIAGKQ